MDRKSDNKRSVNGCVKRVYVEERESQRERNARETTQGEIGRENVENVRSDESRICRGEVSAREGKKGSSEFNFSNWEINSCGACR